MHLPRFAISVLGQALALLQAVVEMNEVERGADPADGGDEMQPAQERFTPNP